MYRKLPELPALLPAHLHFIKPAFQVLSCLYTENGLFIKSFVEAFAGKLQTQAAYFCTALAVHRQQRTTDDVLIKIVIYSSTV